MIWDLGLRDSGLGSTLKSTIINQDPLGYGTVVKLGLIPTKGGTRSSILTSYFKLNECGRCKLEINHHSGAL